MKSNRDGIGAAVRLVTGMRRQFDQMTTARLRVVLRAPLHFGPARRPARTWRSAGRAARSSHWLA
jgi:hypothetical protein